MTEQAPLAGPPPAHHRLTRAVARGLRRRCGVEAGDRLLVAVSGGADSVALLRALAALAPRRRWRLELAVGHVHHHLRDEAADGDARFVETLAGELGLSYHRADLDPSAATGPGNVEAWARRSRYAALGELAGACGAGWVVTAHQADDQLETLLLRLVRGTHVRGLRGIAWRARLGSSGVRVIRPMLGVNRADVVDFLRSTGQPWREDHTNADVSRRRARLRRDVVPVLRELRGDAAAMAVRLSEHACDVQRLIDREVRRQRERLVRFDGDGGHASLPRDEARHLPRVALTGLLRELLREAGVPGDRLTRAALAPIVRAVRDRKGGERRFDLAGGARVVVSAGTIRVT